MTRKMTIEEPCLGLDDTVDLAGWLSFPASDPPGWTPTHVGAPAVGHGRVPRDEGPELLHEVVQRVVDDLHFLSDPSGEHLAGRPRSRQTSHDAMIAMTRRFHEAGLPAKQRPSGDDGAPSNVEAVLVGTTRPSENVVIGARYEAHPSGVVSGETVTSLAVLLALAHSLAETPLARTVRLVAFVDRPQASVRYLDSLLREGPTVSLMVGLDMLGVARRDLPWFLRRIHGRDAEVVALVGGRRARAVVTRATSAFERAASGIAATSANLPLFLSGLRASHQRSFAKRRIPTFMVTGLGPFRDTSTRAVKREIDLDRAGRVCLALAALVRELANEPGAESVNRARR